MSIIIKGMEMPKDCNKCPMTVDGYCRIIGYPNGNAIIKRYKPLWCPLVEVPTPHGDLIDRRELEVVSNKPEGVTYVGDYIRGLEAAMNFVDELPTLIEAEE